MFASGSLISSDRNCRKLYTGHQSTVRYEFEFDAKNMPGGVYFLRLQYGNKTETRKMIVSK